MAVHAQSPPSLLPDFPPRTSPLPSFDNRLFLSPLPYGSPLLDDSQPFLPSLPPVPNHQRLFHPVATPISGASIPSFTLFQQPVVDVAPNATRARKRRKESTDRRSAQPKQQHLVDLNHHANGPSSSTAPQSGLVSTGLRLAFDDERSIVTSSRPDAGTSVPSSFRDDLSAQLSQQQEELDQLLKSQADQLRQVLEESRQRHSKCLLTSIEESLCRQLQERELELERVHRRSLELEDQMKLLSMESHMWQSKAKSTEAMVAVLRANLQQAVVQSREHSKEGCGDSEADDAASAHLDENAEASAHRQGELVRACRKCRMKEVSILLLPCLHLCLCNDCKGEVIKCPICNTVKTANVEVYLS